MIRLCFLYYGAYTEKMEIEKSIEGKFWENLNDMVQNILMNEKLYIVSYLNGHVRVLGMS